MPNALDIGFSFPICIDILPERGAVESKEETMTSIQNDRTDETTVRRLLQQTSAAQPASRAKDDPRAQDPNMIVRLLLETSRLACRRYDRGLRARLPGMTLGRCAVLIQLAQHE